MRKIFTLILILIAHMGYGQAYVTFGSSVNFLDTSRTPLWLKSNFGLKTPVGVLDSVKAKYITINGTPVIITPGGETLQSVTTRGNSTTTGAIFGASVGIAGKLNTYVNTTSGGADQIVMNTGSPSFLARNSFGFVDTEAGGNTGSNLYWSRYADNGTSMLTPYLIGNRGTGIVDFKY